jgi:hypothetical protein
VTAQACQHNLLTLERLSRKGEWTCSGGWTLNRLNAVGIRRNDYAGSPRAPRALWFSRSTRN